MRASLAPLWAALNGGANRINAVWLLLGLLLGLPLLALLPMFWPAALPAWLLLTLGIGLAPAAWLALVHQLLLQNSASLARLVPGQVRSLRRTLLLAWLLLCGTALGLSAGWGGQALRWGMPAAGLLLLLAWSQPYPWLGLFAPLSLPFFALALPQGPPSLGSHDGWLDACLSVLVLVAGALLLAPLIRQGGRQHQQRQQRLERWREAQASGGMGWANALQFTQQGVWKRSQMLPYALALKRQPQRPGQPVPGAWLLGLGPALHWATPPPLLLPLTLGLLLLQGLPVLFTVPPELSALWGLAFGLTIGLLLARGQQMRHGLAHTRAEQGLLRLLPGSPQGAAMNRALAARLALNTLSHLTLMLPSLLLASGLMPRQTREELPLLIAIGLAELWMLCRDWSRTVPKRTAGLALYLLLLLVLAPLQLYFEWSPWQVALPVALINLGLFAWRWQCLPRWPTALPAGRR